MLSEKIIAEIETLLSKKEGREIKMDGVKSVGGGSINLSYCLNAETERYFLKCNSADRYPGMFDAEQEGLELMRRNCDLRIPKVIDSGRVGNTTYLLLEFLEEGGKEAWEDFGEGLAKMHRTTNETFGLDYSNYIGSLRQSNEATDSWADFFMGERLQPLVEIAAESGNIDPSTDLAFERFYKEIESIFPNEPPALIHGDLWSGNYFFTADGNASIFDPAVYYGHREMDIAMTTLFGSCSEEFYTTYNRTYPLEKGWQNRLKYANLYPLLVHLVLFGRSYLGQIKAVLKPFA